MRWFVPLFIVFFASALGLLLAAHPAFTAQYLIQGTAGGTGEVGPTATQNGPKGIQNGVQKSQIRPPVTGHDGEAST